jgi:hypothetical protein
MKMAKIVFGACALMLLLTSIGWASWSSSTGDQIISSSSPPNSKIYAPALAAGPQGQLYAVWVQGIGINPMEVFFSKSEDSGNNWTGTSGDFQISALDGQSVYNAGIYGSRRIDIAVDGEGRIFVVWPEKYTQADFDTSQEVMVVISTDGGTTWINSDLDFPISDTLTNIQPNYPALAIDHNDNVHVVWNQINPATGKADIYYSASTDHGATWSGRAADRYISYPDSNAWPADIAVGPDNKIHVVWKERNDANYYVNYGVSTNGGVTFSSETADRSITPGVTSSSIMFPRLVVSSTGNIHCTYCLVDTVFYVGSTNGGTTWNSSAVYRGVGYDFHTSDIGVTSTGDVVVVFEEAYDADAYGIWAVYSFNNGQTWTGSLEPVTYDDGGIYDRSDIANIVVTAGDTLHVDYLTNTSSASNSYQEMGYSRNNNYLAGFMGTLSGYVRELDGTTPIPDAIVEIRDYLNNPVAYDTTDGSGFYSRLLNPATYSAYYSHSTHHDTSATGIIITGGNVTAVNPVMRPIIQGTISGTVFEQTGVTPLPHVAVRAIDSFLQVRYVDTTDALGNYSLILYPATYSVEFAKPNFRDTTVYGQVVVESGSIDLDMNLRWSIPSDDIAPQSLDDPSLYMILGEAVMPQVTIRNLGYQQQTFDLNLTIRDDASNVVYNHTIPGITLDSLTSMQQIFPFSFIPAISGDHSFTITSTNIGDQNTGNDVMVAYIMVYQHQSTGGPDLYGYRFEDSDTTGGPIYNWIDISGTGTQLSPGMHYFMAAVPIGFSFPFYGNSYDSAYVNSHGQLNIGVRDIWLRTNDCPLPDTSSPHAPMAAIYWDDLKIQYEIGQGVYYQYFDQPINDYTVIQWLASRDDAEGLGDTLEFEVILYQDGNLLFQYKQISDLPNGAGQNATVGLEYDQIPSGISYLCNDDNPANRLKAELAIKWFTAAGCNYLLGDINGNGNVIGADVTYAVRYFKGLGTVPPDSCYDVRVVTPSHWLYVAGDVNASCTFAGSDVTRLVSFFKGISILQNCGYFPLPAIKEKRQIPTPTD